WRVCLSSFWKLHLLNKEKSKASTGTEDRSSQRPALSPTPGLWCQVSICLFVSSLTENRLIKNIVPSTQEAAAGRQDS
ncbi:hypothetical protein LEMLEM_LOCUS6337, partial [Lemmus lemmus]